MMVIDGGVVRWWLDGGKMVGCWLWTPTFSHHVIGAIMVCVSSRCGEVQR